MFSLLSSMATEELGSLRCSANRPCSLSRWRKESASQAIKLVTQSGMALPCSAPSHGALLRNDSKLHGTRAIAQVLQQHQFKPISCSGQSANRSATRTCFHSRTSQTTRSIHNNCQKSTKRECLPTGSCHSLPQGAPPVGHCEKTASNFPRLS